MLCHLIIFWANRSGNPLLSEPWSWVSDSFHPELRRLFLIFFHQEGASFLNLCRGAPQTSWSSELASSQCPSSNPEKPDMVASSTTPP